MKCPKCNFDQSDANTECPRCGVIFAKLGLQPSEDPHRHGIAAGLPSSPQHPTHPVIRGPDKRQPVSRSVTSPAAVGVFADSEVARDDVLQVESESEIETPPEPLRMHKEDWIVLAVGLGIAAFVFAVPLLKHIFNTLTILVHEMGHMIFGWVLGYPSVPAFDLMYGGGVTIHTDRNTALLIVIYCLMAFLIFTFRKNIGAVILLLTITLIHLVLTFTRLNEVMVLFMGHGTELLIAGIFFYRGLSGAAVVHSIERPLYSAIAFFIVFSDVSFAYRLVRSPLARVEYAEAKGGGHWMDFSRIAIDHFHVNLTSVASIFFLCCLITLPAGFLAFRYQEYLRAGLKRLLVREPESVPFNL